MKKFEKAKIRKNRLEQIRKQFQKFVLFFLCLGTKRFIVKSEI